MRVGGESGEELSSGFRILMHVRRSPTADWLRVRVQGIWYMAGHGVDGIWLGTGWVVCGWVQGLWCMVGYRVGGMWLGRGWVLTARTSQAPSCS